MAIHTARGEASRVYSISPNKMYFARQMPLRWIHRGDKTAVKKPTDLISRERETEFGFSHFGDGLLQISQARSF